MSLVRSSNQRLKYANKSKLEQVFVLFDDTRTKEINRLITYFLANPNTAKSLPDKSITSTMLFSAVENQLLAKEASTTARSILKKKKKLEWYLERNLTPPKHLTQLNKQITINWQGNLNLDSRFVTIERSKNSFDYWINIKIPKQTGWIQLPIKKTKHMADLESRGYKLKTNTIRLQRDGGVGLSYQMDSTLKNQGSTLGIDVGMTNTYATNLGQVASHYEYYQRLKLKKHGSKAKAKLVAELKSEIDKSIKQIDFSDVKEVILEDLTGLKVGKKLGNRKHHWSYCYTQNRIKLRAEESNVLVRKIKPQFTSQTCSGCGYLNKNNRLHSAFICLRCDMEMDADINAAINISNGGIMVPLAKKAKTNSSLVELVSS